MSTVFASVKYFCWFSFGYFDLRRIGYTSTWWVCLAYYHGHAWEYKNSYFRTLCLQAESVWNCQLRSDTDNWYFYEWDIICWCLLSPRLYINIDFSHFLPDVMWRYFLCLPYKYFHGNWSDELFSVVNRPRKIKHNIRLEYRPLCFTVEISKYNVKFYSNSFLTLLTAKSLEKSRT